jgi:hypothetical protein
MGLLDEVAAVDSLAFVDTDAFGETVIYRKDMSIARSISAVVDRRAPEDTIGGNAITPHMVLSVRNDSTYGIDANELNVNGDRIEIYYRIGDASRKMFTICELVEHDAGMLLIRVR